MVSFTCNYCQDVVKKPKVVGHANMCGSANFTCVDCMEVFDLHTIKTHTSCVTETEKYQGKWRQKTANNFSNNNNNNSAVSRKRSSNDSDDDDDDNDEKEKQKRHILRPPRAPMHFDSDDDDDDSWVRSKPQSAAKPNGHNAETSKKSPKTRSRIESSPNNNAKTEEEDEAAALAKKSGDGNGKMKPLPRAMTAADCVVPSFVLGTDDEIAQVAGWVFDEAGQSALDMKTLSKKMVERYNARIAKHVRSALEAAVAKGKLRLRQADGLVTMH